MRRTLGLASLGSILVSATPAADATPTEVPLAGVYRTAGLSIGMPPGWRALTGRGTACTNPVERITLAGGGALVHVQEALPPLRSLRTMPRRPGSFAVEGEPSWIACCPPADREGWVLPFRDGGRAFYAYVYPGRDRSAASALATLDSLVVTGRA